MGALRPPEISEITDLRQVSAGDGAMTELSGRERLAVAIMVRGYTDEEIASEMVTTIAHVRGLLTSAEKNLKLGSRQELGDWYIRWQLKKATEPPPVCGIESTNSGAHPRGVGTVNV
jgi:DNA-binding CsgD family transcriptional regulator